MALTLSPTAARALMVAAQGLDRRPGRPASKADLLDTVRRLGALQIDTIHVVARSPYLALWSRLGDYPPEWLEELLAEGALFEYWAHAACFLPIEDYSLYRHRMRGDGLASWQDSHPYLAKHRQEAKRMLSLIREQGPVRSADFQRREARGSGWWDWKPEKRLLESLFSVGELMVARRDRFQRVYDLRERVLPSWDETRPPSRSQARRALALKAVRALGVATPRWAQEYFRLRRWDAGPPLEALADEGALLQARVDGWDEAAYIHPQNAALAEAAQAGELRPELTTLLSPFDSLIWDRRRMRAVFGFDYAVECYLPAARRRYGYFCLPILHRGELIGRLDPKAHRKDGLFEVKALYLEPGVAVSGELVAGLATALAGCARWHGTPEVIIGGSDPPELAGPVQRAAVECI
jgi:uncharacterized protein YcaQ